MLVDDDPSVLDGLIRALRKESYLVLSARSADEALHQFSQHTIDVVVSDQTMPGMTGIELLRKIQHDYPETVRIILTGQSDLALACRAIDEGLVFRFFTKPCIYFDLNVTIRQALHQQRLEQQNGELRQALTYAAPCPAPRPKSATMMRLMEQVARVASLDSTVVIAGESGTGKTTVARMIHQSSPRALKPFVSVNCAALPHDLIEAELFGVERGAYTGAVSSRPGRAELADGGTLFLDEIGDMPLELQPKLLTFLDDRLVKRLGGRDGRRVDVRVVVATNQDLEALCRHKRFREDLYYRVSVISLHIAPLRERKEDMTDLIDTILERIAAKRQVSVPPVAAEARAALIAYAWPGNVRQLENQLERATALCADGTIRLADLDIPTTEPSSLSAPHIEVSSDCVRTLDEVERQTVVNALHACHGNKAAAARQLGISEKTIYNKIKRWQLADCSSVSVSDAFQAPHS